MMQNPEQSKLDQLKTAIEKKDSDSLTPEMCNQLLIKIGSISNEMKKNQASNNRAGTIDNINSLIEEIQRLFDKEEYSNNPLVKLPPLFSEDTSLDEDSLHDEVYKMFTYPAFDKRRNNMCDIISMAEQRANAKLKEIEKQQQEDAKKRAAERKCPDAPKRRKIEGFFTNTHNVQQEENPTNNSQNHAAQP